MAENVLSGTLESRCPICLELYVLPVKLPSCGHKFCFLCIKGVALRTSKCALCRRSISQTILTKPEALLVSNPKACFPLNSTPQSGKAEITDVSLCEREALSISNSAQRSTSEPNEVKWYYSGFKGWWEYDERTSEELEKFYKKFKRLRKLRRNKTTGNHSRVVDESLNDTGGSVTTELCTEDLTAQFELMITGFVYVIDLDRMVQYRQNSSGRVRAIKRVRPSDEKFNREEIKGISGIKSLAGVKSGDALDEGRSRGVNLESASSSSSTRYAGADTDEIDNVTDLLHFTRL